MIEHVVDSVEQTEAIAAALARSLPAGSCVGLDGELGAGKTQFVRGMVRGLGGDARAVCSPTFVLLNAYDAPGRRVFHLDAYRVAGAEEFEQIGFAELLEQGGLVVVEWASRVAALLPVGAARVRLEHAGETRRIIRIG